jgi:hypothetical protein
MDMPFRITKGDSADLGFACDCLGAGALTRDEFADWLSLVIERTDPALLPSFVFDLLDAVTSKAADRPGHLTNVIGFSPGDPALTRSQHAAVDGIAWVRRGDVEPDYDVTVSRVAGAKALHGHPEIRARYETQFPFVTLPQPSEAV